MPQVQFVGMTPDVELGMKSSLLAQEATSAREREQMATERALAVARMQAQEGGLERQARESLLDRELAARGTLLEREYGLKGGLPEETLAKYKLNFIKSLLSPSEETPMPTQEGPGPFKVAVGKRGGAPLPYFSPTADLPPTTAPVPIQGRERVGALSPSQARQFLFGVETPPWEMSTEEQNRALGWTRRFEEAGLPPLARERATEELEQLQMKPELEAAQAAATAHETKAKNLYDTTQAIINNYVKETTNPLIKEDRLHPALMQVVDTAIGMADSLGPHVYTEGTLNTAGGLLIDSMKSTINPERVNPLMARYADLLKAYRRVGPLKAFDFSIQSMTSLRNVGDEVKDARTITLRNSIGRESAFALYNILDLVERLPKPQEGEEDIAAELFRGVNSKLDNLKWTNPSLARWYISGMNTWAGARGHRDIIQWLDKKFGASQKEER